MRSVTICLFGFKVYEYFDDSGENMIEALAKLVDEPEEPVPDDGRFYLAERRDYTEADTENGRVILDRTPEDPT